MNYIIVFAKDVGIKELEEIFIKYRHLIQDAYITKKGVLNMESDLLKKKLSDLNKKIEDLQMSIALLKKDYFDHKFDRHRHKVEKRILQDEF